MRDAIRALPRYIAGNRIGKRFLYCWADASICPSDLTVVFAFEDDYAMGILTSSTHQAWAHAESSTLEDRPRYTPTSCFETFPWPGPSDAQFREIGDLARGLIERRQAICLERSIGLTDLYNQVDDGAWRDLADLHKQLDRAVASAYGWPASIAGDELEIRSRLATLHGRIGAGTLAYRPFERLVPQGLLALLRDVSVGEEVELGLRGGGAVRGELLRREDQRLVVEASTGEVSVPFEHVVELSPIAEGEASE